MSELVTVEECRALVTTPLKDADLAQVIERVTVEIEAVLGEAYLSTLEITETLEGGGENIFLKRAAASVSSVTEYGLLTDVTGSSLTEGDEFYAWGEEGTLQRLGGVNWGKKVVVVYKPTDELAKWKQAVIDLVRILVSQTAMRMETVGGEYMYSAPPNWEAEKRRVMRRLGFGVV